MLPPGLRAFADDDVALLPTGITEAERAQLIALLIERGDVARLDRLGASPDKGLAKAARRAIHLLRTKGAQAPTGARVYRAQGPYAAEVSPSYASVVDGRGERVVWYVEPGDNGYSVFELELSETVGVQSLVAIDVSRKAWREQVAHMKGNERAIVGEIPGVHARCLIERAYRRMVAAGRAAPESFAPFHLRLQASDEELAKVHPVRPLVADLRDAITPHEVAALIERFELQLLAPDKTSVTALDRAIGDIVTSQAAAEEKPAQIEAAIVREAQAFFTAEVRACYAERLLELSLLIATRQSDADGLRAARACVEAADQLRDGTAAEHPLILAMYRRLVPAELLLRL